MTDEFPRPILNRDRTVTGEVTGSTKHCTLEACGGRRYYVRWPDGKHTWPCSKGIVTDPDGTWRIS